MENQTQLTSQTRSTSQIKVLIAPNSFKECADSVELINLFKASFNKYIPDTLKSKIDFTYKPVSDGGDGFLEVCKYYFGLETLHFEISNAFNTKKFFCPTGFSADNKMLYIESAEVLGLKRIPSEHRKPMMLSSKGMGELLLQLIDGIESGFLDIEKVIIGIGGTGTNDLGLGMMETFGLELYDKVDNKLEVLPQNFRLVKKLVVPEVKLPFKLKIVNDVENPLLGENGACKVFARQKGATNEEIDEMEKGFENILRELELDENFISKLNGAGGGLAAALKIFFNAEEISAKEFIQNDLGVIPIDSQANSESSNYDLVVTGEGKYDSQSLLNKGAMIIANYFAQKNIPVYIICGETEGDLPENENIHVIELSEYFDSTEESLENIDLGIDLACKQISKYLINLMKKI